MTMKAEANERLVVIGGCPFRPSVRDVAPDRGSVPVRDPLAVIFGTLQRCSQALSAADRLPPLRRNRLSSLLNAAPDLAIF
jgi:hypothetical protein